MRNKVPAVMINTVRRRNGIPGSETKGIPRRAIVSVMPGRKGFDWGLSKERARRYPWNTQRAMVVYRVYWAIF
jgi:hypothetical protein